jgi:hypothetical protein
MIIVSLLLLAPAIALADNQTATPIPNNNVTVVKPIETAGSYGTGTGQIDTPLCIRVDAQDNVYILQDVHYGSDKIKAVINEYDRNLTFIRSFDVLEQSTTYQGGDSAGNGFYYDTLATTFDLDNSGKIYILCGWDIVVYDRTGKYLYQFPDNSFMSWIGSSGGTNFYYPAGIVATSDGYVVTTSGDSPNNQAIFMTPDGKLSDDYETGISNMQDIIKDANGSLYISRSNSSAIYKFDSGMDSETTIDLNFNGTYSGGPSSLAIFPDGNIAASANGIFLYYPNGTMIIQFMDNNVSVNNESWGRPIAVNSSGDLIVASGMDNSSITPQPIGVYEYQSGWIIGATKPVQTSNTWILEIAVLVIAMALYGLIAFYFIVRKFL